MIVPALTAAVALGVVVGVVGPLLLRRLPVPVDAPPEVYRRIAGGRFALGAGSIAAAATLAVFAAVDGWPARLPWLVLATAGVLLACIDACTRYLPARVTAAAQAGLAVAVLLMPALGSSWVSVGRAAVGAAAAAAVFSVLWLASRGAVGFGDVRFAPLIGGAAATVSLTVLVGALLLGSIGAVLFGLAYQAWTRQRDFPYSPGLLLGAFAALLLLG